MTKIPHYMRVPRDPPPAGPVYPAPRTLPKVTAWQAWFAILQLVAVFTVLVALIAALPRIADHAGWAVDHLDVAQQAARLIADKLENRCK